MQATESSQSLAFRDETLLPFMTIPSRIVNSSRKHQYGWRCSGRSCTPFGWPVMIRSVRVAKVEYALVSSCRDSRQVGSTFRTCAMLMSKPGISQVLSGWMGREKVSTSNTLLDPKYFTWMSNLERRSSILCNLTGAKLIGLRKMHVIGPYEVYVSFQKTEYVVGFLGQLGDESRHKVHCSKQVLEFLFLLWSNKRRDASHFLWTQLDTLRRDDASEVLDLLFLNETLVWVGLESCSAGFFDSLQ